MAQGQAKRATLASKAAPAHPQTEVIELPPARKNGGMPLISALQARHSTREFSDQSLSKQALSDLLWARLRHQSPKRRSNHPVLAGSPDQQFVTFAQTVGYARG